MDFAEIFGAITGFAYVILEIKQKRLMWIIGGVSALVYIVIFFDSALFAAMALQLWYLGASFYGWFMWGIQSKKSGSDAPMVIPLSVKKGLFSFIVASAGFLVLWYLLENFTQDPMPLTDAIIASLSLLATYWVANRHIQHWLLWIVADVLAVYMYLAMGLYATAVLYFIYTGAAVVGYLHWRKFPRVWQSG